MPGLFWRQFGVLCWKNWIVLSRHPWLNILRCFLLPIGYGVFLAVAQIFLNKPNNYGIGNPVPVFNLINQFDGSLSLIWADSTNNSAFPSPHDIISHITSGFSSNQLRAVRQVDSVDDIPSACPPNFNLFSQCFAAISFDSFPTSASDDVRPINYTIHADGGLFHIDVVRHKSDYEERLLPLQWAIDSAIIDITTGFKAATPLEWPFTQESNQEQDLDIRLSYIRGLRSLLVIALFICYVGIAYQLPGAYMGERANLVTGHLKAMGLMDSARILSWHISLSLAYLPAWLIVSLVWHFRIFTGTNAGLVFVIHLLLGLTLASWSFFIAAPFGKSPQMAAVASTILAIVFAILAQAWGSPSNGAAFIYSVIFPPGFYIFTIRAIAGFEVHQIPTTVLKPDPDNSLRILPLIIAAVLSSLSVVSMTPGIPALAAGRSGGRRLLKTDGSPIPADVAISVRGLGKDFKTSLFGGKKSVVTAIGDLSLDVPKFGIYVLLGSNGFVAYFLNLLKKTISHKLDYRAGKSTAMSILGGLLGRTRGTVKFEGNVERPPRGTIGIVPQKNVLFPELTCYQTLRVWRAIKRPSHITEEDDIEQLLKDCDLGSKIHYNADALSGGQKRKLQLAIGLIGGSKNTIAVLAAPGKLVAHGSPVYLKSTLGEGYTVDVTFNPTSEDEKTTESHSIELLERIRTLAPATYLSSSSPSHSSYHLKCKDAHTVHAVLQLVEDEKEVYNVSSYSILGTSIEDIFLGLMHTDIESEEIDKVDEFPPSSTPSLPPLTVAPLELTHGRRRSPLSQAFTIFHKRALIARRSWLTPALAILVAVAGTCVPLFFLSNRATTCTTKFQTQFPMPLYLPTSAALFPQEFGPSGEVLVSPPGILTTLGPSTAALQVQGVASNSSFVNEIQQTFRNQSVGGVSVDLQSGSTLVAWEATPPGTTGLILLNLASNIVYNHALNTTNKPSPRLITASYENLPGVSGEVLNALKWLAFYGAAMAVFPAFFSLYVSKERRSSVQAMQLSNGLADPVGLWLGHLLFDSVFAVIAATLMIIVFAVASNQFHGLGLFWLVLVLYGMVGALFSYCISLVVSSPLAAFAASAGYQVIMFVLYIADYLLILTYAKSASADNYTLSILSPVASALRSAFVSVNLFSLLCDNGEVATASELGMVSKFGGPILYLILYGLVLFGVLVWVDSGSIFPRRKTWARTVRQRVGRQDDAVTSPAPIREDVFAEATAVAASEDALRVLGVVKSYGARTNRVVDNVSFGVGKDTVFALLGPNGAGKTTTFNVIRGDVVPDEGDVLINGTSIVHHPRAARLSLGVCPQFTAIDSQLTVREHLLIYGRLKGLYRGEEVRQNIESLMHATSLYPYADRLASKLSGGNQRKLSLAIALIGNPSCILIDEFSTGIDAKMKRDMWKTLRNVAVGKAIIITTHSMEEASALATKVGILAKGMLAVGTTEQLAARYATYEVHFACRTREDVLRAQELMSQIPGARMADDVATRFEVPVGSGITLPDLFSTLSSSASFTEYAVERATLESVFLK
ncbi:hypothetical protein EW026_g1452 [Hermanssonia centrifuga]|uniref:ABC transporter domain-containing protein n=1 Tax=Hermanssonia centrifuga TaxID=98765 RepID=A0A4S4KRG4_9APHY|nr:hypothetical protein EW026_g1452 [Hermanssonia centrifuga]